MTMNNRTAITVSEKESLFKTAQSLACSDASDLLPDRWRGKPQAVFQMMLQARELGIEPVAACRLTYLVHGQPALKTEAVIGLINAHAGMASEIMFEERGELMSDDYEVRAYALSPKTGERLDSIWVGMRMAKAEGWSTKKGNKYGSAFRAQMLRYRAAGFWARLYAPHVMMGMYTTQEVNEMPREPREVSPEPEAIEALNAIMAGHTEPGPDATQDPEDAEFIPVSRDPDPEDVALFADMDVKTMEDPA